MTIIPVFRKRSMANEMALRKGAQMSSKEHSAMKARTELEA